MGRQMHAGVRGPVVARLAREASDPGLTVLVGARGSGTSGVLHDLHVLLDRAGVPNFSVTMRSDSAAEQLTRAPLSAVHLIDDLELASQPALEALAARLRGGARGACALVEDHLTPARSAEPGWRALFAPDTALPMTRYVHLEPLTHRQTLRIITEISPRYIDALTVATLHTLSWGRPAWLLELLQLHALGALRSTPWPALSATQTRELGLTTFRFADERARSSLTPDEVAAGAALSRLEPRTLSGLADLVGGAATTALVTQGILLVVPDSETLFSVPELYATALRLRSDPGALAQLECQVAQRLQMQEALGVRLSEFEAYFCASTLDSGTPALAAADAAAPGIAHGITPGIAHGIASAQDQIALTRRVALDLLAFGASSEVRDLLLRGAALGLTLGPLERTRVAVALHGPRAGVRGMEELSESRVSEQTLVERVAHEALCAHVTAHAAVIHDAGSAPFTAPAAREGHRGTRDDLGSARWLLSRWNDTDPVHADASRLRRIATQHPVAEIALAAAQLIDLENVKRGVQPGLAPNGTDRIAHISRIALSSPPELRDLLNAAVVTEALLSFYTGETAAHHAALDALAETLPGTTLHRRWLLHLDAAGKAVLAGDVTRARVEWERLAAQLPHFLPLRLTALIADTGDSIANAAADVESLQGIDEDQLLLASINSGARADRSERAERHELDGRAEHPERAARAESLPAQFLAYCSGQLDRIGKHGQRPSLAMEHSEDDSRSLSIDRLARAHIHAAGTHNPAALTTVAEQLMAHGYWGAAAHALHQARCIFVRRRATGSVNRCSELLEELTAAALRSDPWFSIDEIPRALPTQLTPRELATARLAIDGLSNKQMAARLRCSVRTVESHLAQARAKLGAADREELGIIMRKLVLTEGDRHPVTERKLDSRALPAMR